MPPVAPLPPQDEAASEPDTDTHEDAHAEMEPVAPPDAPTLRIPQDEPTSLLKPAAFIVGQATPLDPGDSRPADLDGFCLCELSANERWVEGNPRWSAEYSGRKYLFSSQQHRDQFLADPTRYAPAYAGHDPVLAMEAGRRIPGKTDYCVNYDGRLYMFSSGVTLARFQRDPGRYASGD
jgi:YHS domain-containing protein